MPESPRRFVILLHCLPDGSRHWDLCLEQADSLATWQLTADPAKLTTGEASEVPARRLPDHRTAYLEYEGPVSGNRGHVTRADRGAMQILEQQTDHWRIRVQGSQLIGNYDIVSGGHSDLGWILRRA